MVRFLVACLAVALFGATGSASARSMLDPSVIDPAALPTVRETALRIARAKWTTSPCAGRERITFVWSETVNEGGRTLSGYASPWECSVVVAAKALPVRTCTVLEHELGHLAGLGHSTAPGDIMNPETSMGSECLHELLPPDWEKGPLRTRSDLRRTLRDVARSVLGQGARCRAPVIRGRREDREMVCGAGASNGGGCWWFEVLTPSTEPSYSFGRTKCPADIRSPSSRPIAVAP